jgi:putative ABC transport system permease protein
MRDAAFESRLYKLLTGYMKEASVEIEQLTDKRESKNLTTLIPVLVFLTIAGFLIINVALGLFGVLWYNINQRRGEIGLRRAIGASGKSVSGQILAEAMVLATLSLLLGTFFAVQFPLLRVLDIAPGVYITAIILAILFIYLLVIVCSLYPGKQAAAILPAVALHEE